MTDELGDDPYYSRRARLGRAWNRVSYLPLRILALGSIVWALYVTVSFCKVDRLRDAHDAVRDAQEEVREAYIDRPQEPLQCTARRGVEGAAVAIFKVEHRIRVARQEYDRAAWHYNHVATSWYTQHVLFPRDWTVFEEKVPYARDLYPECDDSPYPPKP